MNLWQFRCMACEKTLAIASHGFCSCCVRQVEQYPYCRCCGTRLVEQAQHCGHCLREEPKWHYIVQISDYQPPLSHWIHQFKFQQQFWLDKPLARLLLLAIKKAQREQQLQLPDVILPVPLFWQRHWQRGFNQAALIAQHLSHWLEIPVDEQSLTRIRATRSQRELTATERRKNLKGAFAFTSVTPYQRVAIVDDVVTTGSTLNAICAELLKQGIKEIQVWTLARA